MNQREHIWNFEDGVITLYYFKFGTRNLPVRSDVELAEEIIGAPFESLKAQSANILFWVGDRSMGIDPRSSGLTDVSKVQKKACDEYDDLDEPELREVVLKIIDSKDRLDNLEKVNTFRKEKELLIKQKQQKLKDIAFFKSLGKDPSKMKSIGRRLIIK
jgi:hypothetical protein